MLNNQTRIEPRRVLLAVLAHPDDETFGTGGTLALYARRGVDVYLVCATRGEAGEVDANLLQGYEDIAKRRESELRCAAAILGLRGVFFLNYRDSGMAGSADNLNPRALINQPLEQLANEVTGYIRRLKPQVVITFDPMGGYGHPDHIAIHKACTFGFKMASDPEITLTENIAPYSPQKLYYSVMPIKVIRVGIFLLHLLGRDPHKFGSNGDIDLVEIASYASVVTTRVDFREVAAVRNEAAACHESQGGKQQSGGIIPFLLRVFGGKESYQRVFPLMSSYKKERDLFEGVKGN